MTKKPKISAQIATKPRPFEKRAMRDIALVNQMVTGAMNHAHQRVVSQLEVKLVESVDESDDYKRGLQDAKAIASGLIKIIE